MLKKDDKKWINKFINIPIIQVRFMYILKISVITVVKMTDGNGGVRNYSKYFLIFVKYF